MISRSRASITEALGTASPFQYNNFRTSEPSAPWNAKHNPTEAVLLDAVGHISVVVEWNNDLLEQMSAPHPVGAPHNRVSRCREAIVPTL